MYVLVARHPPLGTGRRIKHEDAVLALDACAHAVAMQRVRARGVSAFVAAHPFLHVRKRRIVVAKRTQDVRLKARTRRLSINSIG